MHIAVLNPGGHDGFQSFPDGAGAPDDSVHAPVNYHAYAACTRGVFCRAVREVPANAGLVLLLLGRSLRTSLRALEALRPGGRPVVVGWKETGAMQVAKRLDDPANIKMFRRICAASDGAISSTPELVELYRSAGCRHVEYVPTPYPVEDARWNFSRPLAERSGVFVGTREWGVHARAHAAALLQACATGQPVTVCNTEGHRGRRRLSALGCPNMRVIEGRMPYTRYLRVMASCRVVFQQDASQVPGQVAGDALLCRMPCVGGNGAVDREVFGTQKLETLLCDDAAWHRAVEHSQNLAIERLSYDKIASRLHAFMDRVRGA